MSWILFTPRCSAGFYASPPQEGQPLALLLKRPPRGPAFDSYASSRFLRIVAQPDVFSLGLLQGESAVIVFGYASRKAFLFDSLAHIRCSALHFGEVGFQSVVSQARDPQILADQLLHSQETLLKFMKGRLGHADTYSFPPANQRAGRHRYRFGRTR